jgi:hypothetical protein
MSNDERRSPSDPPPSSPQSPAATTSAPASHAPGLDLRSAADRPGPTDAEPLNASSSDPADPADPADGVGEPSAGPAHDDPPVRASDGLAPGAVHGEPDSANTLQS